MLVLVFLLSACYNDPKGEYVAKSGGVLLNFKSGNIVDINGSSYPYELKGNRSPSTRVTGKQKSS